MTCCSHIMNVSIFLKFPEKRVDRDRSVTWPPHSPDFTHLYFLFGVLITGAVYAHHWLISMLELPGRVPVAAGLLSNVWTDTIAVGPLTSSLLVHQQLHYRYYPGCFRHRPGQSTASCPKSDSQFLPTLAYVYVCFQ